MSEIWGRESYVFYKPAMMTRQAQDATLQKMLQNIKYP
jgi:hypothetical protein